MKQTFQLPSYGACPGDERFRPRNINLNILVSCTLLLVFEPLFDIYYISRIVFVDPDEGAKQAPKRWNRIKSTPPLSPFICGV